MCYLKKIEKDETTAKDRKDEKEIAPIIGDELMFVPRKINVLVKQKQKNIFLIHDKNRDRA